MAAAELVIQIRADGAEQADRQLARLGERLQQLQTLGQSLASLALAAGAFASVLARTVRLDFASEIEAIRNQMTALTGDAESAARAVEGFLQLAIETRFDTSEVARFGALLMGVGVSAEEAQRELRAVLDLMAGLGVRRADFDRVAFNLLQIRGGAFTAADIRQMVMAMPGIGMALAREVGAPRPLGVEEISALARARGGEEFYRLLLSAAQRFEGASRQLTISDVIANLRDEIGRAMLPSAELLTSVLRFLTSIGGRLVSVFGALNRALGGVPGALLGLAASALAAATALQILERLGIGAAFAQLAGVLRWLRAGGIIGALAALGRLLGGLVGAIGRLLPALARIAGIGALLGGAITLLGQLVGGQLGEQLGTLGTSVSVGGVIGAIIGSVVPVIGTALGGLIGAAVGAIVGLVRILLGGREDQRATRDAAQQTARNTQRIASTMQEIKVNLVGGGERARFAATRYEVEAYLRRLAVEGI